MKAGVTKQQFISSLEATIKLTRTEVVSLELTNRYGTDDTVIIHFESGDKKVSIEGDSGIAIIRDVCKAIG